MATIRVDFTGSSFKIGAAPRRKNEIELHACSATGDLIGRGGGL